MKKLISVILILALLSCATALAAGTPTIVVDKVTAKAGDEVNVNISIKNNPGIASMKLKVSYPDGITLTKVSYNSAMGGNSQQPQRLASPVTLNWYNGAANTTGDRVFATLSFRVEVNAAKTNAITVTYNPDDVYNIKEENITFAVENGYITVTNPTIKGDIDGDNALTNTDLVTIARYIVGLANADETAAVEAYADMNGDGGVNNLDLVTVARKIVGLE